MENTWRGPLELLASAVYRSINICVIRPGIESSLICFKIQGGGVRANTWLKLENKHYEGLRAASTPETQTARSDHVKEIKSGFRFIMGEAAVQEFP